MSSRIPRIIGLAGVAGSGKSTIAAYLVSMGFTPLSYAAPGKALVHVKRAIEGPNGLAELHGLLPRSDATRHALQTILHEEAKGKYGDDVWIRAMESEIVRVAKAGVASVVIDDVRFPLEVEQIRSVGGCVFRLQRDASGLSGEQAEHASERGVRDLQGVVDLDNNRPAVETVHVLLGALGITPRPELVSPPLAETEEVASD